MKLTTMALTALLVLPAPVLAFGADANSKSTSTSSAKSASVASANVRSNVTAVQGQGQQQSITGNSSSVNVEDRLQAPAVFAPSMSSGHPCAIPTSVGISIIGGGISGGANSIDKVCMLMQSGQIDAANYLMASQDNEVCIALRETGAISADSLCGETPPAAVVSTNSGATPSPAYEPFTRCEVRKSDGAVMIRHRFGADKEASRAACLAKLGY
jgi:hypothetical protein